MARVPPLLAALLLAAASAVRTAAAFRPASPPPRAFPSSSSSSSSSSTALRTATTALSPDSSSGNVGVVGRGYVAVLTAKLAALRGYDTWMLCPPGQEGEISSVIDADSNLPPNLELIQASDSDATLRRLGDMEAVIFAVDDQTVMDDGVIDYVLNPEVCRNVKRAVGMSRNLNGEGMGFLVKASKMSANAEVWDMGAADEYRKFESKLKEAAAAVGARWTIARAGTLKGGACGEDEHTQFLSRKFYDLTKKDIVTWQLLFDCRCRGVDLRGGDVMPGPGGRAVFTATSSEPSQGDTSRAGIAEAMVRSLEVEGAGDADFGVGTREGRDPPSDEEWEGLFGALR